VHYTVDRFGKLNAGTSHGVGNRGNQVQE